MTRFVFVGLAVIGLIYKAECAAPTAWTEPPLSGSATNAALNTTVPENTPVGALGVTIAATGATEYTLPSQEVAGMFTIANSGVLSLVVGTLDYEKKTTYTLTVAGGDGSGATATITTTLSITNVNEPPTFAPATYSVTAETGSGAGTAITTVTATDQDVGDTITYTISAGNTNSDLAITPATGVITVAKALNIATMPSYTLTVIGTDSGNPPQLASSTVSITVGNVSHVDNSAVSVGNVSHVDNSAVSVGNVTNVDNAAVSVTATGFLGVLAFMLLYIHVM